VDRIEPYPIRALTIKREKDNEGMICSVKIFRIYNSDEVGPLWQDSILIKFGATGLDGVMAVGFKSFSTLQCFIRYSNSGGFNSDTCQ
jgi:hypothetical protein